LIKIIEAFVGEENRSSVRLHDIHGDKFMLAEFYGKIINAYADISGQDIEDAGTFKALVSGDTIKAQKKHKDPFDFRNYAKLIFSANKLPRSQDDDMFAYGKRWVILHFKSFFKGVNKDRNPIDKLTTEEELSGLLNIALAGFVMLERDGGFEDILIEDIRKEYERNNESVITFLNSECYIDMGKKALVSVFMPETEFYKAYTEFFFGGKFVSIGAENDKPLDSAGFEIELSKYGIFKRRRTVEGKEMSFYQGVITRQEAAKQNMQILKAQRQKTLDS
jgi:putative DNA primase/helicase